MGLAVTWQREFQDVSSVSAERLNSHGYRQAYLGKGGIALFFLCCGQAFWIRSPRGSTPTAAKQLQRGTGWSYASLPLTGTSPDPVPRFSRFGVQKRWRGASLLCLAIGVFALGLEVLREDSSKRLVPASTVATATSSSTMLFTSFSNVSTSTAATGLSFGASTTLAGMLGGTALGFGLNFPGAGGAAAVASTTTSTITTTTVTTTSTSTSTTSSFTMNLKPLTSTGMNNTVPFGMIPKPFTLTISEIITPVMTYGQLSGLVNKWSLELEDQEKHFLHQVTQVNAWDYTLIENSETIIALHGEVQKVKQDQKRLEQELYFILSQQKELEDLLTPLEESVKDESGSVCLQHTDEERERIYQLAEDVYAQLKRTAQDLKDIIEYLNTFGSPADTTGPLQQICKILNAHMDFLQWIHQTSGMLQRNVEEIEVFEHRHYREQECNVRIAFD
ncbi:nucleoporin-62 C-terminal-like protein [Delphinapterus leucas]|uniref:Nucleoporin-62 C-terminal-like protein n=1 Tax=Delphinapterus leucas TaxID=9749 RepID=A0A7F8K015_DELLE|nr:nucleoporin-62 C-terminal-like protein [Delphinapterus leucas]